MSLLQKIKNIGLNENINTGDGQLKLDWQNLSCLLLDAINTSIIYIGNDYKYQYANKTYADWFEINVNELIGKPVKEFLGKEVYQRIKPYMDKAMKGEQVQYEDKIIYKSVVRYIEVIYIPDLDEIGKVRGYIAILNDVTEKRQTEKELRRKQQELQDYVDNPAAGLHWLDADGIILWANNAELRMFGYSEQEYIGHPISEFHSDQKIIGDIYTRLSNNEPGNEYIAEMKCSDGSVRTVMISSGALYEDGKFIHTRCFTTDITNQLKLSNIIKESEQRFRDLIDSLPAAIYTTDCNGYINLYNEAAAELWGRQPEIGRDMWCGSWKIYEPGGTTPVALDSFPMAIALKEGRKVYGKEIIIERPDGLRKNVQSYPEPIFDSDGNITGGVNMLLDITEIKIAEEQRVKLAAIVESSDDAIIGKTLDGIVTSWNYAAQQLFGYTEEEMIGQSVTKLIPPDRIDEEKHILSRLRQGERVEHFETKRITKNGRILDISLTTSPIRNSAGKIIGASKIARNITLQREAERLMHESEERFRMAVETTNLGTWEYSPHSFKLYCSPESRKICGLTEDVDPDFEVLFNHVYENDKEYFLDQIKAAINPAGEGRFDMQLRIHRYNDKEIRWVRAQGKMFFDTNDFPERLIGTMLDITEEKTKEEELKESIELFQTMADNVPAMIWMSGTDKFNDYFNKTWLQFTGRTLEQESDEGWLEGVHPDDVVKCIDTYTASFKEQKEFYTEYRLRRYDGEFRWISDNSVPRFSPEGEFLGFISACIDMDDQKRFREKIQESELLFKTISNASPAALWMTNEEEENVFVSDTWLKWTGKNFEEVIHRGWVQSVLDEDKESTMAKFRQCFKHRKYFNAEFRFMRTDGEIRWGLTEGYPFYDFKETFSGYAGSVTDITEIKKLEQRKDDFIKMASHELKTPITSINGYVQLLLNIYNEADEQRLNISKPTVKSSLNTIAKQVVKLTRLISELLDLSKIESGKLELHKTEFDLGDMVEETVQDVRHTASKHAILVHNDFEGKLFADKDRIAQVLLNLLTNAIKYSPTTDIVEVFVEGDQKFAIIKVKDYGIGIDKKDHLKIFERFYRVEGRSEQTFPGFGIGLFIASEIIHRHNGTILVESEKGKGSLFTVTLPLTKN